MRSARELLNSLELACWSVDGIRRDEAVEFLQEVQREAIEAAAKIADEYTDEFIAYCISDKIRALLPTDTQEPKDER